MDSESPDRDLGPDVITVGWPRYQGVLLVGLVLCFAVGYFTAVLVSAEKTSSRQIAIMSGILALSGAIAIEFAQRAYRFEADRISVRHFGIWQCHDLPPFVEVFVNSDGSFSVYDPSDGPFRLYVPKDVGRPGAVGVQVTRFYARHHRIAENAR